MSKNPVLYKALVVGVIVLFIGVGIQPAFAKVSIESNNTGLVEITVQFYEIDRTYNHTVMLTQDELAELENLINDFEIKIDIADNKIETEAIYEDIVVSLNDYGILPKSMSIEKAQRLVTGKEHNPVVVKLFERWYKRNHESMGNSENMLCLISGELIDTNHFTGARGIITFTKPVWNLLMKASYFIGEKFPLLEELCHEFFLNIQFGIASLWWIRPFGVGFELFFGDKCVTSDGTDYNPCHGIFYSYGLNGKTTNFGDDVYGQLPFSPLMFSIDSEHIIYYYSGAIGYTGLKIRLLGPPQKKTTHYFNLIGSALWFKIGEEHP